MNLLFRLERPAGRFRRRRNGGLLEPLASLLIFMMVGGCSTVPPKASLPGNARARKTDEIRIGTYNVFTATRDFQQTVAVIRGMNADVVALQEIAPRGAVMLDRALRRDYPYRYFSNGLGIVSRYPLCNRRYWRSWRGGNGLLFAEIEHARRRMQIANVHLDPLRLWTRGDRLALPVQLLWRQGAIHRSEIGQVLETLEPDLPAVVLGDFNSATDAAPAKLRASGFSDSFAAVTRKPDRNHTLHFPLFGFRTGRRIDFIFHDRAFQTIESRILPGRPSDHDPVVSVLGLQRRLATGQNISGKSRSE